MKTLQLGRKACPQCLREEARPSTRRKLLEYFLMVFLLRPYRCRDCGYRFWGFA